MFGAPSCLLETYRGSAEKVREDFIVAAHQLPPLLRDCVLDRLSERSTRAQGRQLLGEYAPWLIADLLHIRDHEAVQKIALAWLHVYFFVLMVDDLIDQPVSNASTKDFIAGSVLYQRGLRGLLKNLELQDSELSDVDSAFIDTAIAGLRDLQSVEQRVRAFSLVTPEMGGQKLAMLRLCAKALMNIEKEAILSSDNLDRFIGRLGVGIQLLDDLTDLEEDYKGGQINYPLYLLLNRCSSELSPEFTDDTLLYLIRSRALTDTLSAAVGAFEEAANTIKGEKRLSQKGTTELYIDSLLFATKKATEIIEGVRIKLIQFDSETQATKSQESVFQTQKQEIISTAKSALLIVAQSS